jgi:hypothetical protein
VGKGKPRGIMNMVGWQGTADIDKEEKQTGDETQVRY